MLELPWHTAQLRSAAALWSLEITAASPQGNLAGTGKTKHLLKKGQEIPTVPVDFG